MEMVFTCLGDISHNKRPFPARKQDALVLPDEKAEQFERFYQFRHQQVQLQLTHPRIDDRLLLAGDRT